MAYATCSFCNSIHYSAQTNCKNCGAPLPLFKEPLNIEVLWSGKYPSLCFGRWEIVVNGKSLEVPSFLIDKSMGTFGTYEEWHFGGESGWEEIFESYKDGEEFQAWLSKNAGWIDAGFKKLGFDASPDDVHNLFLKIQEKDWRHNSCGGCI